MASCFKYFPGLIQLFFLSSITFISSSFLTLHFLQVLFLKSATLEISAIDFLCFVFVLNRYLEKYTI